MAVTLTCDGGCGTTTTESATFIEAGFSQPKAQYCPACWPVVEQFRKDRDALHTAVAKHWQTSLAELTAKWHLAHPNGRLPDE